MFDLPTVTQSVAATEGEEGEVIVTLSVPETDHHQSQLFRYGSWEDVEGAIEWDFLLSAAHCEAYDFHCADAKGKHTYGADPAKGQAYAYEGEALPSIMGFEATEVTVYKALGMARIKLARTGVLPYVTSVDDTIFAGIDYVETGGAKYDNGNYNSCEKRP